MSSQQTIVTSDDRFCGFRGYEEVIIQGLAKLDPLEFHRRKKEEAERLGLHFIDLDRLVAEERRKLAKEEQAQPESGQRFKLLPAGEIQARPPDWLVRGLIETDSLAEIFGDSASCKSFLAIDLSLSIATGTRFHNHQVRQGPVIYLAGEGQNGLARRFQAWSMTRGQDYHESPFFVSQVPAAFLDTSSLLQVITEIDAVAKEHGAPQLIVIDTLARNFGPGDENSTSDMNSFIAAVDSIRAKHGSTVLLVHHTGHGEKSRSRGAYSKKCALDCEYRVSKKEDGTVLLEGQKMKDGELPAPMAFRLQSVNLGMRDEYGQPVTSAVLERMEHEPGPTVTSILSGARKVAFEALASVSPEGGRVHVDVWRDAAYRAGISASTEQAAKQKAFVRAVSGLRDTGHIGVEDDHYWIMPDSRT